MRVGIGHDTHRLAAGGPLVLGGVRIPHDRRLVGHSDADVLLHAVTDALLGAAAWATSASCFPTPTRRNRGRDSAEMLGEACDRSRRPAMRIVNLDCIVFAQRPKLVGLQAGDSPAAGRDCLTFEPEQVGVKAKTGEGVDAVGREEAIWPRRSSCCEHELAHAVSW